MKKLFAIVCLLFSSAVVHASPTAAVIESTGTGNAVSIIEIGTPSGSAQNDTGGALNINATNLTMPSELVVLVSSTTDAQIGYSILRMNQESPTWNDPDIWITDVSNQSNPQIRIDGAAPNFELVNTSTDNAHGLGKFEPFASAYHDDKLQINSRAWDNSTFENMGYWTRLSSPNSGLTLSAQSLINDSSVLTSSDTSVLQFGSMNNHTVGITGPLNPTASYTFSLPSTANNQGNVLYQANNGRGNNQNARALEFTSSGSNGYFLTYTGGAPTWARDLPSNVHLPAFTKTTLPTPSIGGQMIYCSDCVNVSMCISTGSVAGAWASPSARTTSCN